MVSTWALCPRLAPPLPMQAVGESKAAVMCALRLLDLEQALPYEALTTRWCKEEWGSWE